MANHWLRLWHDMPTDPKWRTISRVSKRPVSEVIAVYVHLLVSASNADERGRTNSFNCEDVASALDLETEQVAEIIAAMQGRVIEGDKVSGWEKRQPLREDGAAERAKAWRETQKERIRTHANADERPDKDKDTEKEKKKPLRNAEQHAADGEGFAEFWKRYPRKKNKGDAEKAWKKLNPDAGLVSVILEAVEVAQASDDWRKDAGKFVPYPASWLNAEGWHDEARPAAYSEAECGAIASYNRILGAMNWPDAVLTPYSPERASALREFLDFGKKPGWVDAYFTFISESLEARAGCGLDWVIRRETYLRCREGNFAALREAA